MVNLTKNYQEVDNEKDDHFIDSSAFLAGIDEPVIRSQRLSEIDFN